MNNEGKLHCNKSALVSNIQFTFNAHEIVKDINIKHFDKYLGSSKKTL